jgi:hypothetical protein
MPIQNHTEIICIIDKSGSMEPITVESIEGFNNFLNEQKNEEGTASVTLYLFNDNLNIIYENYSIDSAPYLNLNNYNPTGNTALLDALGTVIDSTGVRLSKTPENLRPEKVLVCILTDGRENQSRIYGRTEILKKITHQTVHYNWVFVFLGANQDSFAEAERIGISKDYTSGFNSSKAGTTAGFKKFSKMTSSARKGEKFIDEDD